MTLAQMMAWQGLVVFIIGFATMMTGLAIRPYLPSDKRDKPRLLFWAHILIALGVTLLLLALAAWSATIWIDPSIALYPSTKE